MTYKIKGTIEQIGQARQGVGTRGDWKTVDFMITTEDDYPRHPVFSLYGIDRVDHFLENYKIGDAVEVSFEPDGRAWKDRLFAEIRAYRVEGYDNGEVVDNGTPSIVQPSAATPTATAAPQYTATETAATPQYTATATPTAQQRYTPTATEQSIWQDSNTISDDLPF